MKFKKTIVLILLLSFLVCSVAVVGADAAAELPYTFNNIHDLLLPAEVYVNNLGQYICVDWYNSASLPDKFVTSALLFNGSSENLPGALFSYNADGRSVNTSGKSWKCITYFDLNFNVLPVFVSGQDYIFDLYFAFYIADLDNGTVYEASDFQLLRFLYNDVEFRPVEIFQPYANVNIAHFNFKISGYDLNNTEMVAITLDRGGDSSGLFRLNYFEIGFIPGFPSTISTYSEEMKAADSIINAGSNVPQPDFNTPGNEVASTTGALNDIEGQFKVEQGAIDDLNNTFDSLMTDTDFSGGTQFINNWYTRLLKPSRKFIYC